jgi:CRISPR/Cas system CSM-associated protein Csm3 (group 7 of RAMP superfamily)
MRTDRVTIEYSLTFGAPFHLGTGVRQGIIDRTVIRDNDGYLYVPGSTFKGVLREKCEQLASYFDAQGAKYYRVESPHDMAAALLELGNRLSIITRIFGSPSSPGRLYFENALQVEKDFWDSTDKDEKLARGRYKALQTSISTQVRLDRSRRIAVKDALYTSEYGIRDLTFQGCIRGWITCVPLGEESGPTFSLLLLLAGLHSIDRIGANKSTGKGRCSSTIKRLEHNGEEVTAETWQSWFDKLEDLGYYDAMMEEAEQGEG